MSHVTLPIASVLSPIRSRRTAAVITALAVLAVVAVLLVRGFDDDTPKRTPGASSAAPAQVGPPPVSGTRPDGGPDESRVAIAVSGR